ncbi:MAG: hypothetical protein JWO19_2812 [Bryobacterales bacterium]|nr:hypothetical protein [Bryobacterales bacterium]
MRIGRCSALMIFWAMLVGVLPIPTATGFPQKAGPSPENPTFGDFSQRVEQYLKVRKALPPERTTKRQEEILDRRHALAQAIRTSRIAAKQGDIFTPEISEQFVRVIRSTLQGSDASNARKTIRQGEPVASLHLSVNGAYPEHMPLTTVPPTLLLRLPQLPERLAYRIVGRDFVLEDTEARLVIDFVPAAIP